MEDHQIPPPYHVVVAFLLHPQSAKSLGQIGMHQQNQIFNISSPSIPIEPIIYSPVPPPPKVLIMKNSIPNISEIDNVWGAIMKPFEIKEERPFLVAINAVSETTGLRYDSFRLVRGGAVWTVGEYDDAEHRLQSASDQTGEGSNILKHPILDIFHSQFEPEHQPIKRDLIYYPYLFQAINLNGFSLKRPFHWTTPLEVELQRDNLKDFCLAPDLSYVLSSVYISPLFNRCITLIRQNRDFGTQTLHRILVELFFGLILDAWQINSWIVKDPTSPPPQDTDEWNLGAPYLSELKPRTALIHLQSVITHISRVRPMMSVINGMIRYISHSIQIGTRYLDQVALEKQLKKIAEIQHEAPKKQLSLLKRISFWGNRQEEESKELKLEDEATIDWSRFASFEGSKPPPQTLYEKSLGRVLMAVWRYQLYMDQMVETCISHAIHVLRGKKRALILGGSSLVEEVAKQFDKGRPLFEGVKLSKRLAREENKTDVHVISEAQIGIYINQVDCCLVGAESILPNGSFINRIGTYLLALAAANTKIARQCIKSVPFFVVATTAKILTQETMDILSNDQAMDLLVMVPPQHPEALNIKEDHVAWEVLDQNVICKGLNQDAFETEDEIEDTELRGNELRGNKIDLCEFGKIHCHRVDPKAPLGVILEGKDPSELTKAWKAYDLSDDNILVENIYSETIPAHLVSGYITERGLLQPQEISDKPKEFIDLIDQYIRKQYPTFEF